jgi:hypothetical protein
LLLSAFAAVKLLAIEEAVTGIDIWKRSGNTLENAQRNVECEVFKAVCSSGAMKRGISDLPTILST